MKNKTLLSMIAVAVIFSSVVYAGLDKEEQVKVDKLAQTLSLDRDQKKQIVKEREQSKRELMQLEKKWQGLHDQLRNEVRKDLPSLDKIDELTKAIGALRGEMIAIRTKSLIFLRSILNEEQKKQLKPKGLPTPPTGKDIGNDGIPTALSEPSVPTGRDIGKDGTPAPLAPAAPTK